MEFPRRLRIAALAAALGLAALGGAWALRRGDGTSRPAAEAPLLGGSRVIVEVLNGSGKRGLARTATRVLRDAGFDVVYFGTIGDSVRVTRAMARRGDSSAAVRVVRALGVGQAVLRRDTLLRVDVTVLLGDDYQPPPGLRP